MLDRYNIIEETETAAALARVDEWLATQPQVRNVEEEQFGDILTASGRKSLPVSGRWRKRVGIEGGKKVPLRVTPAQMSKNHRKLTPGPLRLKRPSRTQFGHKMGTPRARTRASVRHVGGPLLPHQAFDLDKPAATSSRRTSYP